MATTRLAHVEHGFHVAYDGAEVKRLEDFGWKRISEAEFKERLAAKAKALADAGAEDAEDSEVVVVPKRKGKA